MWNRTECRRGMFSELLLPLLRNQLGYGVGQALPSLRSYYYNSTPVASSVCFRLRPELIPLLPYYYLPFLRPLSLTAFRSASLPVLITPLVRSLRQFHIGDAFLWSSCLWKLRLHQQFLLFGSKQPLCSGFCLDMRRSLFSFNEEVFIFLTGTVVPESKEPAPQCPVGSIRVRNA